MADPHVDPNAIGPADPRRSYERRLDEAFSKPGPPRNLPDPPQPEPGSVEDRRNQADTNMRPVRERTGTGLSAERHTPRRW